MKLVFLVIFIVFIPFSSCEDKDDLDLPEVDVATQEKLARILSLSFLNFYITRIRTGKPDRTENEPRFPIIPPFEQDELTLPDTSITIPPDSPLSPLLHGNMSFCQSTLSGLTSIWNDFSGQLDEESSEGTLTFALTIDSLKASGLHDMSLQLFQTQGEFQYSSDSSYLFGLSGLDLRIHLTLANISVFSPIDLIDATVDLNIHAFHLDFENAVLNGAEFEEGAWNEISVAVTKAFAAAWESTLKVVVERIFFMVVVKEMIKDCRPVDLLGFAEGDFSCLTLPEGKFRLDEVITEELAGLVEFGGNAVCPGDNPGDSWTSSTTQDPAGTTDDQPTEPEVTTENFQGGGVKHRLGWILGFSLVIMALAV